VEAFILPANQIYLGHGAILKNQFRSIRRAPAQLIQLFSHTEAGRPLFDNKKADPFVAGCRVGLDCRHHIIRPHTIGDKHLAPVDHIVVSPVPGGSLNRGYVRTGVGFGNAQRPNFLPAYGGL